MSDTVKRPADDWISDRDVDTEGGPVAVQYLRCPHCKSRLVLTTTPHALLKAKAYYCEECDAESLPI
jgi:uncharacterized protein with PIN domain